MSKSHRNCVVPNCPNRRDRCKWGLFPSENRVAGHRVYVKRRLCGTECCGNTSEICQSVTFSRLPKDSKRRAALRKQWLNKIPRRNVPLSSHSCVCSVHFVGGRCDYRNDDVPVIFEGCRVLPQARSTRTALGTTSREFHSSEEQSASTSSSAEPAPLLPLSCDSEPTPNIEYVLADHFYTAKSADRLQNMVEERDRKFFSLEGKVALLEEQLQACREELNACKLAFTTLSQDPVAFKFYTGLSVEGFEKVMAIVGEGSERMDYTGRKQGEHEGKDAPRTPRKLTLCDELLLVLTKFRHNFPESDLANRFGISQATVSRTFSTWILCLYYSFKEVDIWPSRHLVDLHMPAQFKEKYPATRVIIDATEFKIEKPANPDVQAATWSDYKNTNTFKLLVGVTPNGVISFLSDLWGGRISDKEITRRSDLLDRLEAGDSMMADKGFDIESLMPPNTSVNLPPFLGRNVQFNEKELVETRRIASLRIHVERAIERIKNFRITHFFPASLCPMAEKIVFVSAYLTLFDGPLVPSSQA